MKYKKKVVIFHDESTFNAKFNDDQSTQWGVKGEGTLRPKSKGSGIMVSDFIDDRIGFLALSMTSPLHKEPERHLNMVKVGKVIGTATNL